MKDWWQSKTIWMNVVATLGAVALIPDVSPIVLKYVMVATNVLNIVLRVWFADTPISAVGKPDQ